MKSYLKNKGQGSAVMSGSKSRAGEFEPRLAGSQSREHCNSRANESLNSSTARGDNSRTRYQMG